MGSRDRIPVDYLDMKNFPRSHVVAQQVIRTLEDVAGHLSLEPGSLSSDELQLERMRTEHGEEGVGVVKRLKAFQSSERDPEIRRREGTAPTPPPKLTLGLEGKRLTVRSFYSGTTLQAAMGPSTPLLILFLLSWSGPLQGQQHHLVEYMERRLAALEVRDPFLF